MKVLECTEQHMEAAAVLFNAYRMFYRQENDLTAALAFIRKNVEGGRSRLFLLFDHDGKAVGLCQLYPSLCSISLRPYYYLSDLYVEPAHRRSGYAKHLMNAVSECCATEGAQRLTLDTAVDNKVAQQLYTSLGYEEERLFITYHQILKHPAAS